MRPIGDMLQNKKAVLFDFDGTLADSIGVWNEADRLLALELTGAAPDRAELRAFREESLRRFRDEAEPYLCYCAELKKRYGTLLSPRQIQLRRQTIAHALLERVDYKPGADIFLRALKARGYILVLATTGRKNSVDIYRTKNKNFAKKAPIDGIFDRVYTCEDVKRIKPDPEVYTRAAADLALPAEACLAFEDSLSGVQAAKAAGIDTAVIYDKYSDPDQAQIDALADWQAGDYPTLLSALKMQ